MLLTKWADTEITGRYEEARNRIFWIGEIIQEKIEKN